MDMPSETHSAGEPQLKIDDKNVAAEQKVAEEVQGDDDKAVTEESTQQLKNAEQATAPIDTDQDEPPKPGFIPRGNTTHPVSGGAKPGRPIKR